MTLNAHSMTMQHRTIRACAAIVIGASAAACGDSPTASLSDLHVTASISRPEFKLGDTTTVTTTITNTSKYPLQIAESSCVKYFEIVSGETIVGPGQYICSAGALSPLVLEGGETRQFAEVWGGDNRSSKQKLGAGTYTLRARVNSRIGVALSPTTTIKILP